MLTSASSCPNAVTGTKVNTLRRIPSEGTRVRNTQVNPTTHRNHALLVESDPQLQALHHQALSELGFQVTMASDDRIVADLLSKNTYSIIVIHDVLPFINAFLLMKLIQYDDRSSRNRHSLICLSCPKEALEIESKAIFLAFGFEYFLTFPISSSDIKNVIDQSIMSLI